uniref:Uncharacterized protein n=1 Tax=Tanacetum cinerariifolium TaxID=118510 RepID=A0A6L2M2Q2_TANCI|nr:hypothetical protein [Tanacetum cinerariifolium]
MAGEDTSQPPPPSPIASPKAPQMVSSVKLPILKKGEYILWTMKMKQYMAHTDYALWEVILNGNSIVQMTKDKADEHLARLYGIKDAKTLWAAIQTKFGESTGSTNKLNVSYSVSTATCHSSQAQGSSSYADELMFSFFANQSSSPQLDNKDLEQIDHDDLEEMDLKWQVATLSMRVKQFYKKTRRKLEFNGKQPVGFNKTKVEYFNCHIRGHFARDCRLAKNSGNMSKDAGNAVDNGKRPAKEKDEKEFVVQDGLGTYDWSYQVEEEAIDFALMAFNLNPSSSSSSNSEVRILQKSQEKQTRERKEYERARNYQEKSTLVNLDHLTS